MCYRILQCGSIYSQVYNPVKSEVLFFPLCFVSVFRELSSVDMIRFAPPRTAGLTNKGYDLSSDLSKGEIGRLSSRIFVSHNNMFCLQMDSN